MKRAGHILIGFLWSTLSPVLTKPEFVLIALGRALSGAMPSKALVFKTASTCLPGQEIANAITISDNRHRDAIETNVTHVFRAEFRVPLMCGVQDFQRLRVEGRLAAIRNEIARIRELNQLYQEISRPSESERFAYSSRKFQLEHLKAELAAMMENTTQE